MDRVISGHVQFQGAESPDGIFSPHKLDTTHPNSKDVFAPSLSDQGTPRRAASGAGCSVTRVAQGKAVSTDRLASASA